MSDTYSPANVPEPQHNEAPALPRVAIVVERLQQPAWVAQLIADLQQQPDLSVFVVLWPRDATRTRNPHAAKGFARVLHRVFQQYDRRRVTPDGDPLREIDLGAVVDTDHVLSAPAGTDEFAVGLSLLDADPDPALRTIFGAGLLAVRHDVSSDDPWPPATREVLAGETVVRYAVDIWLEDATGPQPLHSAVISTDRLSVAATEHRYYRHLQQLLAARLAAAARGRHGGTADRHDSAAARTQDAARTHDAAPPHVAAPTHGAAPAHAAPPARTPADKATAALSPRPAPGMVRSLSRMATLRAERGMRARLQREDWALAVVRADQGVADPLSLDPSQPNQQPSLLLPPRGSIWADPFPIARDGRNYVFFEEMERGTPGRIALMELTADLQPIPMGPVLQLPYHLSYPFIFEWRGSLFMLPETEQNRTVEVHRCVTWPDVWTLEAVLLDDVSAVDATLVEVGDRWWMFVTMNPRRDVDWNTNLYLFHAPGPLGPWTAHPLNPVKSDVRNSRSAGRLFRKDGRLYRPAQDCAERYGHALAFNEVTRLDIDGFAEHEVHRVRPGWQPGVVGVHTVNQHGDLLLLDCKLRRRKSE